MNEFVDPGTAEWLRLTQGMTASSDALAESTRVVVRIGGLARAAAAELPFDTEPVGFTQFLEAVVTSQDDRA